MYIPALLTVVEALALLATRTGRGWNRSAFFSLVVDLGLPMRSITPMGALPVIAARGKSISAQLPFPGRRLAVLSTLQIKALWVHGKCQTRSVALEPGEPGYLDWTAIKIRREAMKRSAHTPESWKAEWPDSDWHDGELMGECGVSRFNEVIQVTDETCRVPVETIEALLAFSLGNEEGTQRHGVSSGPARPDKKDHKLSATDESQAVQNHLWRPPTSNLVANEAPSRALGQDESSVTDSLATLFDPVPPAVLERMFSADGKWAGWCERAARNGLKEAREGRGLFNPFLAALWFVQQGESGWDLARCYRTLARNLPPRSHSEEYRLTGLLD